MNNATGDGPGLDKSRRSTAFLSIEPRRFPAASMRLLGRAGLRKIKMTRGNQKVRPEHRFHPQRLRNKWQTHRKRTTSVSQIIGKAARICLTWRCMTVWSKYCAGSYQSSAIKGYPCGCLKLEQDTEDLLSPHSPSGAILRKLRCCPWRAGQLARAIHVLQLRKA